mgnify:CR=1 FL=1
MFLFFWQIPKVRLFYVIITFIIKYTINFIVICNQIMRNSFKEIQFWRTRLILNFDVNGQVSFCCKYFHALSLLLQNLQV